MLRHTSLTDLERLAEYCLPDGPGTLTISPGVDDVEPLVVELDELEIELDELDKLDELEELLEPVVGVDVSVVEPAVEFK